MHKRTFDSVLLLSFVLCSGCTGNVQADIVFLMAASGSVGASLSLSTNSLPRTGLAVYHASLFIVSNEIAHTHT